MHNHPDQQELILILGMHRSGTSVVTRLASLLGFWLPANLIEANEFNESGYWESLDVRTINDQLLRDANSAWFDPLPIDWNALSDRTGHLEIIRSFLAASQAEDPPGMVIKDPRICRTAPIWLEAIDQLGLDLKVIIAYRNPLEVAASLRHRDHLSRALSLDLWSRHVLEAERHVRGRKCEWVSYASLLEEQGSGLQALSRITGIDLALLDGSRRNAISEFISSGYRHHCSTLDDLAKQLGKSAIAFRLFELLERTGPSDSGKLSDAFDEMRAELDDTHKAGSPAIPRHVSRHFKPRVHKPNSPETITVAAQDRMALRELSVSQYRQIKKSEGQRALLGERISRLETSIKQLESDLVSGKDALENKAAEVSRLGDLNRALQEELTDLHQLMELKQGQLEELTDDNEALRADLNRTRHSLDRANEGRLLRGLYLARAVERRKDVEHTKSLLLRRLQREKGEIHRLRQTRDQLQRQQQASAAKIATLEYQLATRAALYRSPRYLAGKLWSATKSGMGRKLALNRRLKLLMESGTFDPAWYVFTYPDLQQVEELAVHYLVNGGFEGRNPCAYFDSAWYLETNADVAETGMNPLLHYLVHGRREGRDPHPLISTRWYAEHYPDCGGQQFALEHFIREGDAAGHSPSPEFSADEYLDLHPDVAQSGMPPLYHYVTFGRKEGRILGKSRPDPKPWDDLKLRVYPGINGEVRDTLPPHLRSVRRRNLMLVAHTAGDRLFGAERSFLDVCQAVDLTQFNVIVVIPSPNRIYLEYVSRYADRVYSFRYNWWRAGQEVEECVIQTFCHLIRENAIDLVYGNTIMNREPFIAAARENVVSVMHIREIISSDTHLLEVIGQDEASVREEIQKRADYLIVNSKATAKEFAAKKERFLVYNAIEAEDFIALENDPGEHIYVGIISSNLPKKGIDDFVRLAIAARERLPRLVFRVIGPESDSLNELMAELPEGDARPNIEVCGYLDSAMEAISKINILVNFSSFAESFGRTVAEAMVAGRPVIVYDQGALSELVEHEKTGFVIPFRAYQAALPCLEQLCQRPELIREMGEAGRKRACAMFDLPVLQQGIRRSFRLALADSQAVEDELSGEPRSMKIAYFQWHFPVPSETFVLNELRFLLDQGHDVIVFCRQSPYPDFTPDFQVTWQRVESPEELAARLRETGRERAHAHFVYPTVTDFLWPACELAGIPFTCIAHAQDIFRYGNDQQNRIGEIGQSPLCQRVLVPGRFHRQYLIERDVPAAKIMVNPQGIDSRLYPFSGGEDKQESRVVSCVQRFVAKKGIGDLIAAGPALKEAGVAVRIYGYGPLQEDYEQHIQDLAADNVQLCGPVRGRDELLRVIRASDLFVTPCVRADDGDMDGIPTVYMEAMAIGTPVVTTAISSISDLVVDGVNGLICRERDPQSIAEKVLEYYAMPSARRLAMRLAARHRVETEFDTGKLLGRLLDLYRQRTVDIVIVSWNNQAELEEVVRRIQAYTGMPYHLIINDNGSQAPVIRFLQRLERQHENVTVLFQSENLYVGPGTNRALEGGKSEYVIYICGKEGFALQPNWERKLVEYLDSHPRAGLAGTLGYSPTYLTGKDYPNIPLFAEFRNRWFAEANPHRPFLHAQGGLFAIRRSMYAEIGGFSEAVSHAYTDVEYSYYVESCDWELGQVPGILSLYNKTRPGIFARLDEQVGAIHPPTLAELERVTRIVDGDERLCNLCSWQGDRFDDDTGFACCPACGSTPAQRSVWRYLSESTLTYRRLAALYVNPTEPLASNWAQQFSGEMVNASDLAERLQRGDRLRFSDARLDLVFLDQALASEHASILDEAVRVLAPHGTFLLRQSFGPEEENHFSGLDELCSTLRSAGLHVEDEVRFSSRAVRFDWLPLLVCRKSG